MPILSPRLLRWRFRVVQSVGGSHPNPNLLIPKNLKLIIIIGNHYLNLAICSFQ